MFRSSANLSKMCFSIKNKSNQLKKLRVMLLPSDRYEEFINFNMKYLVKYEVTHRVAGIPDSEEAMHEYREILNRMFRNRDISKVICCVDDEKNPEIVAINAQKLIRLGDREEDVKAKTKQVKKFYEILRTWNNLFPVPELMKKYNITRYSDDLGFAIHPEYIGLGLANRMAPVRREICKLQRAPMTGAWMSALGTQKACARDGWEVVYEISYEKLGRILGVKFETAALNTVYMILKV